MGLEGQAGYRTRTKGQDLTEYPNVLDEWATIREVVAGKSLSRLGDGEFKHATSAEGGGRQVGNKALAREMRAVLHDPHPMLCVGIPTMNPQGPKYRYKNPNNSEGGWHRHEKRFMSALSPNVQYYSAFVSRPDSAPWIYTREFAETYESVWSGKRVFVLGPKKNKVATLAQRTASHLMSMLCPHQNAYEFIASYESAIVDAEPDVALLSCGPTATVLAHRLCKRGIQAIDFGSGAMFLLEQLTGQLRKDSQATHLAWKKRHGRAA